MVHRLTLRILRLKLPFRTAVLVSSPNLIRFTCTYGGSVTRVLLHLHLRRQYVALVCDDFCAVFGLHVATLLGTFDLSWGITLC
jgi:hypothetical protein